ncbi:hypothetical protein [Acinetobacter faecalis]|uniref:hypothetical protein n=1 Tax=Acinetobacter faecalis TaxID=2665161 RepID=UPI002A9130B2|nr:hypothetical protein [Acinetobacter faecalis]MDY6450694.1 hypothetical protein [Acinetobacter faecalis]
MNYKIFILFLTLIFSNISNANETESSMVVISRNVTSLIGSKCAIDIYLDGTYKGTLQHKETLRINTTGGDHDLVAEISSSNCDDKSDTVIFNLKNNQRKYFDLKFIDYSIKLLPAKIK